MITKQNWIKADFAKQDTACAVFRKTFSAENIKKATLSITAKGVYYAELNGKRIGDFIMAPGWTEYKLRLQYQTYDITDMLKSGENTVDVTLAAGWYHGRIITIHCARVRETPWDAEIIGVITLEHADGSISYIGTDESWQVGTGPVEFSDIYDGEIFDARKAPGGFVPVTVDKEASKDMLIPQEGEKVVEHEKFAPVRIFKAPNGETVVDFGQNLTGYPVVTLDAKEGERISLSFGETLDKDGNFYNANYRSAKCQYVYICVDGVQTYKPRLTFYGFRYIRIDEFPESCALTPECFTAVAVYSDMKKTGYLNSSDKELNRLFSNVFWGQRDNFLDVPTDCPQRDERLGWTGDAQIFCKTASYNFDVEKFFSKWLNDCIASTKIWNIVGFTIPNAFSGVNIAAAWSDAAVTVPWQIYLTYGNKKILENYIDLMISHVKQIMEDSPEEFAWKKGPRNHSFGDWLGMDAPAGSYRGATDGELIQSAYFAKDTEIISKALKVLGRDKEATEYAELHEKIKKKFQSDFPEYKTQTECVLALHFGLAKDMKATAKQLADLVISNGSRLTTGFVGTPFILYALSENGYTDVAYSLLLQTAYPSWLYSVRQGATTMWEHWDSINEKGEMWSTDMNSFNHYGYGSVAGWVYEVAAGINTVEEAPGFERVRVCPHPDKRLGMLEASIDTRHGKVHSKWYYDNGTVKYEITVPVCADIIIDRKIHKVEKGTYTF